jgi:hypothetical protein
MFGDFIIQLVKPHLGPSDSELLVVIRVGMLSVEMGEYV